MMTHRVTTPAAALFAVLCFVGCESREEAARQAALTRPVPDPPRLQVRLVVNSPDANANVDPFPDPYPALGAWVMHVDRTVLMHEGHVEYASPITDDAGKPVVGIRFTGEGATLLGTIAQEHANERIAFILDGKVLIAPVLRGPIGGEAVIDGGEKGFTTTERRELLAALNSAILRLPPSSAPAATQPEH
jgi:preprotein translocase subunit SecD